MTYLSRQIRPVIGIAIVIIATVIGGLLIRNIVGAIVAGIIAAFVCDAIIHVDERPFHTRLRQALFGTGKRAWIMVLLWLLVIVTVYGVDTQGGIITVGLPDGAVNGLVIAIITLAIIHHQAGSRSRSQLTPQYIRESGRTLLRRFLVISIVEINIVIGGVIGAVVSDRDFLAMILGGIVGAGLIWFTKELEPDWSQSRRAKLTIAGVEFLAMLFIPAFIVVHGVSEVLASGITILVLGTVTAGILAAYFHKPSADATASLFLTRLQHALFGEDKDAWLKWVAGLFGIVFVFDLAVNGVNLNGAFDSIVMILLLVPAGVSLPILFKALPKMTSKTRQYIAFSGAFLAAVLVIWLLAGGYNNWASLLNSVGSGNTLSGVGDGRYLVSVIVTAIVMTRLTGLQSSWRLLAIIFAGGYVVSGIFGAIVLGGLVALAWSGVEDMGTEGLLERTSHMVLGRGKSAYTMALLWAMAILAGPITLLLSMSGASIQLATQSQAIPRTLTPFMVAFLGVFPLTVLHHDIKQHDAVRLQGILRAVIVFLGVILVWNSVLPNLANWPAWFGAESLPQTFWLSMMVVLFTIPILIQLLVFAQRVPFSIVWRSVPVGVVSGALIAVFLSYPAYTGVYARYIPDIAYTGSAHEAAFRAGLILAGAVLVLTGPIAVLIARPADWRTRLKLGSGAGLIAGMMSFYFIGSSIAGIIASSELYGVAVTRIGYNDAEWVVKLAAVVNNNFPLAAGLLAGAIVTGTVVGGLAGLLTPIRTKTDGTSEDKLMWMRVWLIASPFIMLNITVIVIILASLGPLNRDLFTLFGFRTDWNPEWNTFLFASLPWILVLSSMTAIVRHLHREYVASGQAGDPALLNAIVTSGILTTLICVLLLTINHRAWIVAMTAWTIAVSVEMVSLGLQIPRKERSMGSLRAWFEAGTWAGIVQFIWTTLLEVVALNLVLIPVVLIGDLSDSSAPPIGVDKIVEMLDAVWAMHGAVGAVLLIGNIIVAVIFGSVYALNLPGYGARKIKARFDVYGNWMQQHMLRIPVVGQRLAPMSYGRETLFLGATGALVFLLTGGDVLFTLVTMMLFGAFLIRESWIERLPLSVQLMPVILLTAAGIGIGWWSDLLGGFSAIIALVLVSRVVRSHAKTSQKSTVRALFMLIALVSIAFAPLVAAGTLPESINGGVSSFDGSEWTIYDQNNSTLGELISYDIEQTSDGTMWFAGSLGSISTFDGTEWGLGQLNIAPSGDRIREIKDISSRLLITEDDKFWVSAENHVGMLQTTNSQGTHSLISVCPVNQRAYTIMMISNQVMTSEQETCFNSTPRDVEIAADGSLWLATRKGLHRIVNDAEIVTVQIDQDGNIIDAAPEIGQPVATPTLEPTAMSSSSNATRTPDFNPTPSELPGLAPETRNQEVQAIRGVEWHEFNANSSDAAFEWAAQHSTPFSQTNDIVIDGNTVYVATESGAYRYESESDSWMLLGNSIALDMIFVAHDGTLWASSGTDLLRYGEEGVKHSLPGTVNVFVQDHSGNLGIGTTDGLVRYNPDSDDMTIFTAANSGLATDHIHDILVDAEDNIWVSTLTRTKIDIYWFLLAGTGLWLVMGTGIGFYTYRLRDASPYTKAKRKGREMTDRPDTLYAQLYEFIMNLPDKMLLQSIANDLAKAGDPSGGSSLLAYASVLEDDDLAPALDHLVITLHEDRSRAEKDALNNLYRIAQSALNVRHIADIIQLELIVNPGQTTGRIRLQSRDIVVDQMPSFLPVGTNDVWTHLGKLSIELQKYHQVSDTGDRLSYMAAALSAAESAQAAAQDVAFPDGKILRAITRHWREVIAEGINTLSGSAELRLELRTRQIKYDDDVTIVVQVTNTGRSAAENLRIRLSESTEYALEEAEQYLERLPPGRSEPLEFEIVPTDKESVRLSFLAMWDDRLTQDKALDFADVVQFYQSSEAFQAIPNPYVVGHPVKSDQMFVGREDIFDFIRENLSGSIQDRTIVLYGQRRTGKTSLLYQVVDGRLGDKFVPVFIDMQAVAMQIESSSDFLDELAYQIERALKQIGIEVEAPEISSDAKSPTRIFNRFLDTLADVIGDKRILLIVDEFELIEAKIAEGKLQADILGYFRSLVQHRDVLVFIFTGTHRLEELSHDYWSILFNIALYRKVSYLTDSDVRALIRQPVDGYLTVDDLAVEKVIRVTAGHPYFVQLVCWALVNHCNDKKRNYATINDINDALDAMLTTGEAHFAYIWRQASADEQLVLAGVARATDNRPYAAPSDILDVLREHGDDKLEQSDLVTILDGLIAQDVIVATIEGALQYQYRLDVLRLWVRQSKSISALVERGRTN